MEKRKRESADGYRSTLRKAFFVVLSLLAALFVGCSSIDCPLNNMVYTTYLVCGSDGERDTLRDTLTVTTTSIEGYEQVVLNMDVDIDSFTLPISYTQETDVFYVELHDSLYNYRYDTLSVSKTNVEHFESIDCTPSFFHTITGVTYTRNAIDSIVINDTEVNYDTSKKHFKIFFRTDD